MSARSTAPSHRRAIVALAGVTAAAAIVGASCALTLGSREDAAVADLGADIRVDLEPSPTGDVSFAQAARTLPGTRWVSSVRTVPFTSAAGDGRLVAVAPEHERPRAPVVSPAEWTPGVTVSAHSDTPLTPGAELRLRVWFADDAGDLVVVGPATAPDTSTDGTWAWSVDVPGDPSASFPNGDPRGATWSWSVAAVDLVVDADAFPDERSGFHLQLTKVSSSEAAIAAEAGGATTWTVATFTDDSGPRLEHQGEQPTAQLLATPAAQPALVRFLPGSPTARLPIAVERGWAEAAGLAAGDVTDLVVAGVPVRGYVAETVPVVRGGFADAHLSTTLLAVNRLLLLGHRQVAAPEAAWITSADASRLASLIADPAGADLEPWRYDDYQRTVDEAGQAVLGVTAVKRAALPPLAIAALYTLGAGALVVMVEKGTTNLPRRCPFPARGSGGAVRTSQAPKGR